jgi:hypothetical protein
MQSDLQALSNDEAEPVVVAGGLSALRANLDSIDERRALLVGAHAVSAGGKTP